jgi:spore coat polysaccharide biosynthesis predicted glycosyltransferase SpsG
MILVRLDITRKIGTGHFRRMNILAKYMHPIEFIFLIISDDKNNTIFRNNRIFFTDQENELLDMQSIVDGHNIDLIIFDLLHYKKNYIEEIKRITGKKIVSFHEYDDISKYSDLSINYNFSYGKKNISSRQFLSGYEYIIFNDEIEKFQAHDKGYVFVSFGGSDPSKITHLFIDRVANKLTSIKFIIHIGHFNLLDVEKVSLCANVKIVLQPENLFKYMVGAKIAVVSGGNMMYEFMYFRIPSIVIAHNKHQEIFAQNANKHGCVDYFGKYNDINYNELKHFILNKVNNYTNKCEMTIDSNGKERIKQSLLKVVSL